MRHRPFGKWWVIVPFYILGGLAFGLADPELGGWAQQFGLRRGLATAASVNIFLPLLVVGLAMAHPRLGSAWLGAVALTVAFVLGLAVVYTQGHRWDAVELLRSVPPVLVMACLGYIVLGTLSVVITRGIWSKRPGL